MQVRKFILQLHNKDDYYMYRFLHYYSDRYCISVVIILTQLANQFYITTAKKEISTESDFAWVIPVEKPLMNDFYTHLKCDLIDFIHIIDSQLLLVSVRILLN